MKERASLTNAVVSILPAPIKNPRRDCNMKNPPRFRTHLEGWRPTVALAGHIVVATVAGLRLVGGTVRSSQDASETHQIVVSTCLLLDDCTFRRLWRATHKLGHPLEAAYAACRI